MLLETYFDLEDPRRLEPAQREVLVEVELDDGLRLRGFIDRVDVAATGQTRIVDYKTGKAPSELFEDKALFQLKFYALVMWRQSGSIPHMLQLLYLGDGADSALLPRRGRPAGHRAQGAGAVVSDRAGVDVARVSAAAQPAVRLVLPPGAVPRVRRHPAAVPRRCAPLVGRCGRVGLAGRPFGATVASGPAFGSAISRGGPARRWRQANRARNLATSMSSSELTTMRRSMGSMGVTLGTPTTQQPAADAESAPLGESSSATHVAGSSPSRCAPSR